MFTDVLDEPFEKPQAISIDEAYEILTRQQFALWIRLLVMSPLDLRSGRCHLARMLGMKRWQFNYNLRALKEKGFLKLGQDPGFPTKVEIVLGAALISPNYFVNFG